MAIRMESLRLIIITHIHPDHFEAVQTFGKTGVLLAIHPEEETFLKEAGGDFFRAFGLEMPDFKVDFHLQEGELKLGSKTFGSFTPPGTPLGRSAFIGRRRRLFLPETWSSPWGLEGPISPEATARFCEDPSNASPSWMWSGSFPATVRFLKGSRNIQRNFSYVRSNYFDYL